MQCMLVFEMNVSLEILEMLYLKYYRNVTELYLFYSRDLALES